MAISKISKKSYDFHSIYHHNKRKLIFYCDKLHCCHNIAIMIKESITSMLAYYRRIDITELILQN